MRKERIVLIENEFGDIGIDAAFWKIPALRSRRSTAVVFVVRWSVISKRRCYRYWSSFILIVSSLSQAVWGKLSDVLKAVKEADARLLIDKALCVVDVKKGKLYAQKLRGIFSRSVEYADGVLLTGRSTHPQKRSARQSWSCVEFVKKRRSVRPPWEELGSKSMAKSVCPF